MDLIAEFSLFGLLYGLICFVWAVAEPMVCMNCNIILFLISIPIGLQEHRYDLDEGYVYTINSWMPAWLFTPDGVGAAVIIACVAGLVINGLFGE